MFPNNVVAESKGKDYFLVYVEINYEFYKKEDSNRAFKSHLFH